MWSVLVKQALQMYMSTLSSAENSGSMGASNAVLVKGRLAKNVGLWRDINQDSPCIF